MSNIMSKRILIVLDFDGVLAVPYSKPERPFPQIPKLIHHLSELPNVDLAVASFNPDAKKCIEKWQIAHCFKAFRHGANYVWSGTYTDDYRGGMSKHGQIKNMLIEECWPIYYERIIFFDDDLLNIANVERGDADIEAVFVYSEKGVTWELLMDATNIYPKKDKLLLKN